MYRHYPTWESWGSTHQKHEPISMLENGNWLGGLEMPLKICYKEKATKAKACMVMKMCFSSMRLYSTRGISHMAVNFFSVISLWHDLWYGDLTSFLIHIFDPLFQLNVL